MDGLKELNLETYFAQFRKEVIGNKQYIDTPYGKKQVLYADWIASGRLYAPIEDKIKNELGPFYANTHSNSSETGRITTNMYNEARRIIKKHVNAQEDDVLITVGAGMTAAIARLISILKLRKDQILNSNERPVVFLTHLEHHSNHVAWLESHADVIVLEPNEQFLPCAEHLEKSLEKFKDRKLIIGAFSACSNVTGVITNYKELAGIIHRYNGYCFVDFAASAPYVYMDMHPENFDERLDAIYFSPHKFLGGPGSCGVLIFNKKLYHNDFPETPGGGNVKWTNPWGDYKYFKDIEVREDGGTPGIIQTIRAALAIRLKEEMNPEIIMARDTELIHYFRSQLSTITGVNVLGDGISEQIGSIVFNMEGIHYNLVVRLLNDRFGIQVRGGWSCASTHAHHLFKIGKKISNQITDEIDHNNLSNKPGWVRVSLHPVMTKKDLGFILEAIKEIILNIEGWSLDYQYNPSTNEYEYLGEWNTSWDSTSFFNLK